MRTLLNLVFNSEPLASSHNFDEENESFVLTHKDLDLQNIFVDEEGNVVGIIDWDRVSIEPRGAGPASLPLFLQRDWKYDYTLETPTHMPFVLEHYRKIYSRYMREATARPHDAVSGDGKYTLKSGLYHAAYTALCFLETYAPWFASRLFKQSPNLRDFDAQSFLESVGSGNGCGDRGKMLLEREISKIFKP